LESAEHVTQQNVSDQLSMDKMIVSDLVKTLEKRNFLTRKPHSGPESRRHVQRDFHQARHQIHRQSRVVAP
jgi:DNA-binding MarR family transcriptional regulator